ncbi:uncharacterized protein LOC101742079 isoform X2 [Bombyx mori]
MSSPWGFKMLGKTLRKIIWNMCSMMAIETKGVPGQACRLVERSIVARIKESGNISGTEWDHFKRHLAIRIPLIMASAVQIAAKMSHASESIKASVIQRVLQIRGSNYSIEEINQSECEVLKNLDFRVPIWTSVEVATLLATEVGMTSEMISGVELMVDLAEFNRFKLENDMCITATPSNSSCLMKKRLRTLHLTAGAVMATVQYYELTGLDPVGKLASITRVPATFITCIADFIIKYLDEEDLPYLPMPRKRKFSEV